MTYEVVQSVLSTHPIKHHPRLDTEEGIKLAFSYTETLFLLGRLNRNTNTTLKYFRNHPLEISNNPNADKVDVYLPLTPNEIKDLRTRMARFVGSVISYIHGKSTQLNCIMGCTAPIYVAFYCSPREAATIVAAIAVRAANRPSDRLHAINNSVVYQMSDICRRYPRKHPMPWHGIGYITPQQYETLVLRFNREAKKAFYTGLEDVLGNPADL